MAKQAIATVDVVKGVLKVAFANGHKAELDTAKLTDEMKEQAMIHGLTQKVRDSFAGAKGDVNYAIAQAEAVIEAIQGGSWNRRGGATGSGGILAEAVARVKGWEVSEAREKIAGLDEDSVKALEKAPSVAAAIAEIRAERAKERAKNADGKGLDDILK